MNEKATILLVDDRPANLIALDGLLSTDERILVTASSGKEALRILSEQPIDLILLDVQMPDMNGFELARRLKESTQTADIPIIFASAERLDHASLMEGFEQGAIDYLLKPLDPEITRAKVSVLLETQRQKRLLREKNLQLEKSALLISLCADIIGVLDAQTLAIEQMNPAFTTSLGYPEKDFIGRTLPSFLSSEDVEKLEGLARKQETGKLSFETRILAADGTFRWLEWNVVVRSGKWFVNARDATEVRRLNASLERNMAQLEAANRELESFSYSVSHDLRAPLRAVHGNALAMEEDCTDSLNEEGKRYLKKIRDNAIRMDRLINDLLGFSRIGKREVRKTHVDMKGMVNEVLDQIRQGMPYDAAIVVEDMPNAYGDYAMLSIVWTNLISNAIKYSSKKGEPRVEIWGTENGGETQYFVRDNGAGFDMAYASKLFGAFQRLHDATEFEGVGIGLAIVQRIVIRHGGSVKAEGVPDEGACFSFTLPHADG